MTNDVRLRGGPFDGTSYSDVDAGLLELESDGLIHRYIATSTAEGAVAVYQFDGTVSPDGGMAGTENPRERLASPLADEIAAEGDKR